MFNKKPFDRVNGEDRICVICSTPYHTKRAIRFCGKCATAKQKAIRERKIADGSFELKASYPYVSEKRDYSRRFKKLQSTLVKMKKRKEWKEYFKVRLDEVLNDAVLMKWINDRRDNDSKKAKVIKTNNQTTKDYPNTRGWYED